MLHVLMTLVGKLPLELTFDAAPNDVVFNKAVVGEKFDERLAFCIGGQFFVEQEIFQRF